MITMGNYVPEQLATFLRAILLGASLGLVYDLLRVLRRLGGRIWGGILDALYCVAASASLFFFVMAGDGELRLFILAGAAGGAVLYFCLLSPLLLPLWALWLEIFLVPVRLIGAVLKKCGKICKKLFSFWRGWFTIITARWRGRALLPPPEGDSEMANIQETKKPQPKKRPRRPSGKLTLLILAVLLVGIAVQLRSVRAQIADAQRQEAVYQEHLSELQTENARLQEDIANGGDESLIEDIARNQLGMASEGEKIFRFQ